MDANVKEWIDKATYEDLLRRWRFTDIGDPMFVGDTGEYFIKRMKELRALGARNDIHVTASKRIGWR